MPSAWRFNGKVLSLTWPQCATSKETVLERIQEAFPENLEKAVVCTEEHADGTPHLHAAIFFKEAQRLNGTTTLDRLAGKHGHYKYAPSPAGWVTYVKKVSE